MTEKEREISAEESWDAEYGAQAEDVEPREDRAEDLGPSSEDLALDRAWERLDEGRARDALEELLQLDPDWPERWIPEALARVELGELANARRILARAAELSEIQDHPDYLWARAQLLLREWRIDEARGVLERLMEIEKSAGALERLALCSEVEGDFDTADLRLAAASALDPDFAPIPRLDAPAFEAVITEAIDTLPPEIRSALEKTEIAVEPVPATWMVDTSDPGETPPDMLGLFVGASEMERSEFETGNLPPRLFLFQRNLERACRNRAELVEQIRITLFHEIGHLLGFDEEGVAELGLE